MDELPDTIRDEAELDEVLSRPSPALVEFIGDLDGDVMVLGAGGKVGPTVVRMAQRAVEVAGVRKEIVAVKIAPFDRYRTIDVVRAVAEAGRDDIALYTGNDDNIIADLLTPFRFEVGGRTVERRIVGGLLGHWGVWTAKAVEQLRRCRAVAEAGEGIPPEMLRLAVEVTDANAAVFDAANGFAGCLPGVHEVLRRQGLFEGTWCLDADETLSPGQAAEIDRVIRAYPHLVDDDFVVGHRDEWLSG